MIIVELPIVYAENRDQVDKDAELGIETEVIESIEKSTFIIPDNCFVRINPNDEKGRTTIAFDTTVYMADLDYECTVLLFSEAVKRGN